MAKFDEKQLQCSFCGKAQGEVKRLIAGPGVYICNECATQEAMLEGLNMKPLEFSKWAIIVQEDTVL